MKNLKKIWIFFSYILKKIIFNLKKNFLKIILYFILFI